LIVDDFPRQAPGTAAAVMARARFRPRALVSAIGSRILSLQNLDRTGAFGEADLRL
jgi:hypothetical protein